jgi:glycosyltransferase involved in cell wall biosynthesis
MSGPKITVVIPTRERLPVLRYAVQTVLAQHYENLQIIVCDNCSTDGTGAFVKSLNDPRLRYINTGRRVSMSENWEFALSHVDGGWVMILGDDDGMLPGAAAKLAVAIEETDCEAITFNACHYFWPGGAVASHLTVPLTRSREVRNCRVWLDRVMNMRAGYTELPILYVRGLVKFAAIERMKEKGGGTFFKSSVPDIYSAIALASELERYLFMADALTIAGSSSFSNAAAEGRAGSIGADQIAHKLFIAERSVPFHSDVPLLPDGANPPSAQALVYESFLQSSFLRGANVTCTPARQLELALATPVSPAAQSLNENWGRLFAQRHGIDFRRHFRASVRLRRIQRAKSVLRLIKLSFSSVVACAPSLQIGNVYEASMTAAALQWLAPSVLFRIWQALIYKFGSQSKVRSATGIPSIIGTNP